MVELGVEGGGVGGAVVAATVAAGGVGEAEEVEGKMVR